MSQTVFYSWQSDLPNKTNRSLIETALVRAVAAIEKNTLIEASPRVDQDTRGVPGSPDIVSTILTKIDGATAFVADVSLVTGAGIGRPSPNPNVLIELGYALKARGSDRVLMVFNDHYGRPEDLPFDLRLKRIISYTLAQEMEPANARDGLQIKLGEALSLVFEGLRVSSHSHQVIAYLSQAVSEIISFLALAEQMSDRSLNPWFDEAQNQFAYQAERLRDLAVPEEAEELELVSDLRELASLIDRVVEHSRALGPENWQEYLYKTNEAVALAKSLLAKLTSIAPVDEGSLREAARSIQGTFRKLSSLATEAREEIESNGFRRWEELQRKAAEEGAELLRLSYFDLSGQGIDGVALRQLALKIHQLEFLDQATPGRHVIDTCLAAIVKLAKDLREFLPAAT